MMRRIIIACSWAQVGDSRNGQVWTTSYSRSGRRCSRLSSTHMNRASYVFLFSLFIFHL